MRSGTKLTAALGILLLAVWGGWATSRTRRSGPGPGPPPDPALRLDTRPHPPFPSAELAALDRDIQARFAVVVNRNFGYSRVFLPAEAHAPYRPLTPHEEADVAALRKQKLDVLFYVMGQSGELATSTPIPAVPVFPILIKGPGFMTGPPNRLPLSVDQSLTLSETGLSFAGAKNWANTDGALDRPDLPELLELRALGDRILHPEAALSQPGSQWRTLSEGHWQAVAVPVLASSQKCVDCHRTFVPEDQTVRLGAPLGAAIYVFRPLEIGTSAVDAGSRQGRLS